MKQAKLFWDQAAKKYAKSKIDDMEAYNYTLGRTRSYMKETDKYLEVGCGTGSTALILAPNVDLIVASDVSDNMIKIANTKATEQNVENATFVASDLLDIKAEAELYDGIMALNLLHLIEDTDAAVAHISSLLKPGGLFISKTVCKGEGMSLKFRLIKTILPIMQFFGKAPYVKFMSPSELEAMLAAHKFEILEAGDHPAPSRYIVARKV